MLSVSQCPPPHLVQTVYYFIASGQLKSRTACAATEALLMAAEVRGPLYARSRAYDAGPARRKTNSRIQPGYTLKKKISNMATYRFICGASPPGVQLHH